MKLEDFRRMLAEANQKAGGDLKDKPSRRGRVINAKSFMGDKFSISPDGADFVIHFGKHAGENASALPTDYLVWLIKEFSAPEKIKYFTDMVDISKHILDMRRAVSKVPK